MKLSCIICAYNEEPRIGAVLTAVANHPLIDEVIVVDDCSKDNTVEVVKRFPNVTLLALPKNMGKSRALAEGLRAAHGELIMTLDADLVSITAADVAALAQPVLERRADVALSLRRNALAIHHAIGLDFTTGERVIPRDLLDEVLHEVDRLPHFGIESYMNSLIIERDMRIAVVPWKRVDHTRKSQKYGWWRGTLGDMSMSLDVLSVLGAGGVLRQNRKMLKLKV